jgi:hypothetical protein
MMYGATGVLDIVGYRGLSGVRRITGEYRLGIH